MTIYLMHSISYVMYDSNSVMNIDKVILAILFFILLYKLSIYSNRINIKTLVFVAFILYIFWGVYASVTPFSDFAHFYHQAVSFASSWDLKFLYDSKSPTTTAYYAFFAFLLGKSYLSFYIASALIWSIQIPILYKALINFDIEDKKAKFIAFMYGFYPGVIFYATVVSSESMFMFLLITSFYLISKIKNNRLTITNTVIVGIVLALFFLTRSNAIVFIIPYFLYFLFSDAISKKIALGLVISLSIPLFFELFLNMHYGNRVSVSASQWGAYNLMVGTNHKGTGGYSVPDSKLAGFIGDNKVALKDAQKNALRIAYHRVVDHPMDFILFATTTKIKRLWETDRQNIYWGIRKSPKKKNISQELDVGNRILDGSYLIMLLTAFAFFVRQSINYKSLLNSNKNKYTDFLALTVTPLFLLAILHIFIEVQPRYHLPFLPFLIVFSGLFIFQTSDMINKFKKWKLPY